MSDRFSYRSQEQAEIKPRDISKNLVKRYRPPEMDDSSSQNACEAI